MTTSIVRRDQEDAVPMLRASFPRSDKERKFHDESVYAQSGPRYPTDRDANAAYNVPDCCPDACTPAIHELLNDAKTSGGLLRRQLGEASFEEADETLELLLRQLSTLDDEIVNVSGCP